VNAVPWSESAAASDALLVAQMRRDLERVVIPKVQTAPAREAVSHAVMYVLAAMAALEHLEEAPP